MEETIQNRLFALQDTAYRGFQIRLMPTVNPETVIGVRTPELRKLAKRLNNTPEGAAFLEALPHQYYEENNLHGLMISAMADYGQTIAALERFLPYVDNWATCDLIRPKAFRKNLPALKAKIPEWMASNHPYAVRFGIEMLMTFFLDGQFQSEYLDWVAGVRSQEYYVNMMVAWYFATALAKQYRAALPYLQARRLSSWTHNKTIQKAVESYRITPEQKAYLRSLKCRYPEENATIKPDEEID